MLQLTDITKIYQTGALRVEALKNINLTFSRGEFVAVLGPSGCGKTTLLNIIGGLDRYDEGDLSIAGRSTREYTDRDMDAYRNHSVGFVFQSYNLISHQSVLANVELALTLSGIGKTERRQRAREALENVGLGDQLHKRPNQLSGGQMQRVAIARAMVNDPDILLADEPTGALDSHTSVQVLEVLKKLACDRLIIMVTHNRELAEKFATRIVELRDGQVLHDSRPTVGEETPPADGRLKKTSMGFKTALSLSLNNLLTKRGRTLITAFAGSIGIIGIALILALSNGVNQYIINVQKETMSSYPITIEEQAIQMDGMMNAMRSARFGESDHAMDAVYINESSIKSRNEFQTRITRNNLTAFKVHLEDEKSPIRPYISDIRYGYNASFDLYAFDPEGELLNVSGSLGSSGRGAAFAQMLPFASSVVTELLPSSGDGLVGDTVRDKYSLLSGRWPSSAGEIVLILDENNEIDEEVSFQLGLVPSSALNTLLENDGIAAEASRSWKYEELLGRQFRLLAGSDYYVINAQGLYQDLRNDLTALQTMVEQAPVLSVSGIVRLEDENSYTQGGLGYTRALTDSVVTRSSESPVIAAQLKQPDRSVLSGLRFAPGDDTEKAADLKTYIFSLNAEQKAEFTKQVYQFYPEMNLGGELETGDGTQGRQLPEGMSMEDVMAMMNIFSGMTGAQTGADSIRDALPEGSEDLLSQWAQMTGVTMESLTGLDSQQIGALLDSFLSTLSEAALAGLYDQLVAPKIDPLDTTLSILGLVNLDTPSSISLYTDTFESKEEITRLIAEYNETAAAEDQIVYTDYIALMISSVTTIINVISYVLIAFVAVSLVVSSIMIGIITYISVLERTKEIGILRAVGASRKDVARVFTAEAFIIGLAAGILGIVLSALLTLPINTIIYKLTDDAAIKAILPPEGALILIVISALLSLLAGWIPSRVAAKKDPVEALRSE